MPRARTVPQHSISSKKLEPGKRQADAAYLVREVIARELATYADAELKPSRRSMEGDPFSLNRVNWFPILTLSHFSRLSQELTQFFIGWINLGNISQQHSFIDLSQLSSNGTHHITSSSHEANEAGLLYVAIRKNVAALQALGGTVSLVVSALHSSRVSPNGSSQFRNGPTTAD